MAAQPWLKFYEAGVPQHIPYPSVPLFHFLRESARKYPENTCLVYQDQFYTYREVELLSNAFARALIALGIQPGQPVALMMPNIPQFVVAYFGILKAGGVVVAMNPGYHAREIEFTLTDGRARAVVALTSQVDALHSLRPTLRPDLVILSDVDEAREMRDWLNPSVQDGIRTGEGQSAAHAGDRSFRELVACNLPNDASLPDVSAEREAIYQYSGGTTGDPKAAIGLHRNLVANSLQFRAWLSSLRDGQETFLTAIPLYHVYGMVIGLNVGIAMGARLILAPNPRDVPELLRLVQTYRVTFFPGVPGMYHSINQHPDVQAGKYDLRSIKACISGSAPLLRHIKERFEALTGGKLVEGYGLSEAPTATHCNPVLGDNRPGSIGLPLPDVSARIVDLEQGERDLPPGEVGELVVRGPQVMSGYLNSPEESARVLRGGWLYTGDIARMDADGYFYLVDRKKEMMKVGGFQVWPREVEEVISLHPAVQEVAVAGVPDAVRGEVAKAWVVLKPGQVITAEEVRHWCSDQLVGYKVPSLVEFRGPLPRTAVGKLLRRELVREHKERHADEALAETEENRIDLPGQASG